MDRYTDEELLYLIRCGNEEAMICLYNKYYKYVQRWIRPYCYGYQGMDFEDYVQVSMISFPLLLESYRDDMKASLRTFMRMALVRRFLSMLKPTKDKGIFQENVMISLDDFVGLDENMRYDEVVGDPLKKTYPEVVLHVKEKEEYYNAFLQENASPKEFDIIKFKEMGYNEKEISEKLNISLKSVYNAVYRYRKKTLAIDEKDEMC